MADGARDQVLHNAQVTTIQGAVYGARKQKHTAEAGDAHGEGNGLRRRWLRRVCAAGGHPAVTEQAAATASVSTGDSQFRRTP